MSTAGPSTIRPSHHALSSHSIFIPSSSSSQLDNEWEIVDNPAGPSIGHKSQRVVMRDKDLIIAFGSELRITSIGGREWKVHDGKVGSYSVLKSPHLNFDIHQLCLNPTGRLLAVVGRSQVLVVVLPRVSLVSESRSIQCRSLVIDSHTFSPSSTSTISKVDWHPWGENEQSLWILTSDGQLREYDLRQPDDPTQTFFFLPTPIASPSRSRYTAIDPLSQFATSFAFYPAESDYGCSMIYVLCANGDIYVMGPILPFRTEIPMDTLQRLKVLFDDTGGYGRDWVEDLVKQTHTITANGDTSGKSSSPRMQREASTDSMLATMPDSPREGHVRLRPPHLTASGGPAPGHHRLLLRQGPIVFLPAPYDDAEDDDVASDLAWIQPAEGLAEPTLVMAWSGGRVDFGAATQQIIPRWLSSRDNSVETPLMAITASIKLDVVNKVDNPTIPVPSIIVDPAHSSRLFIQHETSIDNINLRPEHISHPELFIDDVDRLCNSTSPLIGSLVFTDMDLGYTALIVTESGRAVAIELELDSAQPEVPPSPAQHTKAQLPDEPSLLATPFDYDTLIAVTRPRSDAKAAARTMFGGKPFQTVAADQLQKSGQVVGAFQQQTRALTMAATLVEERFDLCVKESQRQLQLLKNCQDDLDRLRDSKAVPRAIRLLDMQMELAGRLEVIVETLMTAHRDGDREGAKRWNEELKTIEMKVGDAESGGLNGRMNALRDKLSTVKGSLARAKNRPDSDPEREPVNELEAEVRERSEEIRRLMRRMEGLSVRVDAAGEGRS